jgi:hypothetical protein
VGEKELTIGDEGEDEEVGKVQRLFELEEGQVDVICV